MSAVVSLLEPSFSRAELLLKQDSDFQASARHQSIKFGVKSPDSDDLVLVSIENGEVELSRGALQNAQFTLSARSEDWSKFFQSPPPRLFQSYWGLLRQFHHEKDVAVLGDSGMFSRQCRIWRLVLDRFRDALINSNPPAPSSIPEPELEESSIIGRYTWLSLPETGKCEVFYEQSGNGPQDLLLLHTAGADSRQCHSIMNNKQLQSICRMTAFDLPAHGRSKLGSDQTIEAYALTEKEYLACIAAIIKKLKLNKPILCGASMGGHVCIAAAIEAASVGIGGSIPLEGCDHIEFLQPFYETSTAQEGVINPERVCGMISPTAPEYYKRLIWQIYSSQAIGTFAGDLQFYFNGWDGRSRLKDIDTKACPVYMLTGEYDYSCTAEMSEATSKRIEGAVFERMDGLGHFPMTEDPKAFVPYLLKAIEHVQRSRRD